MNPRHLTTSLAALALALPAARAAAQPDVVSITRRANPAVITLNTYNASGRQTGLGSGFFLSDGRIATNRHVVEGSSRIDVMTVDGRKLGSATYAEAVGGASADLAILPRVTAPPATLNLARGLPEAGEGVIVIGAPEGLSNTVSTGIVSAIRQLTGRTLVQISAPISHGSSGGPVLNMRGEVIGVSVSVLSEGQNLNFAVPVTELARLASGPRGRIDFSGDLRFGGGGSGGRAPGGRDISDLNLRTLPSITLGQTVSGRLTSSDFRRPDGSYADAYVYNGRAGEVVTVTLRSNAFDAWAVVDDPNGPMRAHDDDSGGNLDAQLSVRLPHAGQYLIVANSVAEGATGAYTLSLTSGGTPQADDDSGNDGGQVSSGNEFDVQTATPIRAGQTVTGSLTRSDTRRDDGSYADSYVYSGRAGERLTVTLRASGFQPWVVVDEPDGPFREHIGGRGSNTAVLSVTLPRTGRYIILANSVNAGGTGTYSLNVQSGGGGGGVDDNPRPSAGGGDISDMDVRSLPRITAGQQVSGRLTTSDFLRSDGSYADGYVYQGRAGETITVTMRSQDLDAWLVVDEPDGPFRETDDDSAGGTDSELTVTLPRSGVYLIVANSVGDPNTGRYTLSVRSGR